MVRGRALGPLQRSAAKVRRPSHMAGHRIGHRSSAASCVDDAARGLGSLARFGAIAAARCSMAAGVLPSAPVWSWGGRILLYLLLLVSRLRNLVVRLGNHIRPRDPVGGVT
jgi:hypothetical protein